MHKIRITQNFVEEYYLLITFKVQRVLASILGHHQTVKQNVRFTYIGEQNVSISHCVICYSTVSNHLVKFFLRNILK
jgi:hypothetical protein